MEEPMLSKDSFVEADFDIRVETLAATLLDQLVNTGHEFSLDQVVVKPLGAARRRVGRDVERVRPKTYDNDHNLLLLEVNRKGLFDTLPNGLFLNLEQEFDSPQEKTKAIEHQIAEVRKFFLPFELATYHPRIATEQLEQKYTEQFPAFIKELWGLTRFNDLLDENQQFLLCYLIPEAQRIVGNLPFTRLIFEAVLKNQVKLNKVAPLILQVPEQQNTGNEQLTLGEDAVLGNSFRDEIPALEVCVYNIEESEIEFYLEEGQKRRLLEELLINYFLPLDEVVIARFEVKDEDYSSILAQSILGYNFSLT